MRKDYDYVASTVSLVLCVTGAGVQMGLDATERMSKRGSWEASPLEDLLLTLDARHFVVADMKQATTVNEWYDKYSKQYLDLCGVETPTTREQFEEALRQGVITVHIVVWDN